MNNSFIFDWIDVFSTGSSTFANASCTGIFKGEYGDGRGDFAEGVIEIEGGLVFVVGGHPEGVDAFGGRGLAEVGDER